MGASYLDVRGGNGVCLSLLCYLLFIPLLVSMQKKAHPGTEGKIPDSTVLGRLSVTYIKSFQSNGCFVYYLRQGGYIFGSIAQKLQMDVKLGGRMNTGPRTL